MSTKSKITVAVAGEEIPGFSPISDDTVDGPLSRVSLLLGEPYLFVLELYNTGEHPELKILRDIAIATDECDLDMEYLVPWPDELRSAHAC